MAELTNYINPVIGGLLIGVASFLMLFIGGRIAGISGIFWNTCTTLWEKRSSWQLYFVVGLILGPILIDALTPLPKPAPPETPLIILGIAGFLVGVGTRMGGGCTSGHGICGISRLSPRSIVATLIFMTAAILTATLSHLIINAS